MKVTFCGHRDGYEQDNVKRWLDGILPSLIEGGAETFYLGGYGAFDAMAAEAVRRQKAGYRSEYHCDETSTIDYCSECGKRLCSRFTNYCPNCGARMEEGATWQQ